MEELRDMILGKKGTQEKPKEETTLGKELLNHPRYLKWKGFSNLSLAQ